MEDQNQLYNLKLHEGFNSSFGIFIMRVPGGWIYDCWDYDLDNFKLGVYVPFNSEFKSIRTHLEPWEE